MIQATDEWDEALLKEIHSQGEIVLYTSWDGGSPPCSGGSVQVLCWRGCYFKTDIYGEYTLDGPASSPEAFSLEDFWMVNETTESVDDARRSADEVAADIQAFYGGGGHQFTINGELFEIDEDEQKVVRIDPPPKKRFRRPRPPAPRSTPPPEEPYELLWEEIVACGKPVCRKRFSGGRGEWRVYQWDRRFWCRLCDATARPPDSVDEERYVWGDADDARDSIAFHLLDEDTEALWDPKRSAAEIAASSVIEGRSGQPVEINGEPWRITAEYRLEPAGTASGPRRATAGRPPRKR